MSVSFGLDGFPYILVFFSCLFGCAEMQFLGKAEKGLEIGMGCNSALRQGLNLVARKRAGAGAARCGGDLGSPRKPAGPGTCKRGQRVKARLPP